MWVTPSGCIDCATWWLLTQQALRAYAHTQGTAYSEQIWNIFVWISAELETKQTEPEEEKMAALLCGWNGQRLSNRWVVLKLTGGRVMYRRHIVTYYCDIILTYCARPKIWTFVKFVCSFGVSTPLICYGQPAARCNLIWSFRTLIGMCRPHCTIAHLPFFLCSSTY